MEEMKKRELYGRLLRCRGELVRTHPFFGRLLLRLVLGFAPCATAYTDMRRIVFDPDFGASLDDVGLKFVLLHEVMHCVLKHCIRGRTLLPRLYNIACDIVVNSLAFEALGLGEIEIDGCVPMHLAPDGTEGRLHTAEEVYAMLRASGTGGSPGDPDAFPDGEAEGKGEADGDSARDPASETLDDHGVWASVETDGLEDEWESRIREAARHGPGQWGDVPLMMRRSLRELTRSPGVDWKLLLADFLRHTRSDYLFERPDRRFADGDVLLPSFCEDAYGAGIERIWVLIDTSGSVSASGLAQAFAEVKGLVEQLDEAEGKLSFFDCKVTEPRDFADAGDLEALEPVGGGGTSFAEIFRAMDAYFGDEPPAAVIVLTDGCARFPPEEAARGVPVLWIMISGGVEAPWGVTAHVETE